MGLGRGSTAFTRQGRIHQVVISISRRLIRVVRSSRLQPLALREVREGSKRHEALSSSLVTVVGGRWNSPRPAMI